MKEQAALDTPTYWYSITTTKYDPATKNFQRGLFLEKVRVVKETEKMLTIERTHQDGYGWFGGHYPTLDAAKEAYRDFCSGRLTTLSEQFAQVTLELSQVDSLAE